MIALAFFGAAAACVQTTMPPTRHLLHPGPFTLPSISRDRLRFRQAVLHSALRTTLAVSFWMQILSARLAAL